MKKFVLPFTEPHILSGLPAETPILVGFSGGADSRTLLHLLYLYSQKYATRLYAAHVEHGIRGDEAKRDLEFCRMTAEEYGIGFFSESFDIPTLAAVHHRGLEEEARIVRYDYFKRIMDENSIPILATAHNADDRLETMLFSLIRGCGVKGISGIPTVRRFGDGLIIRPLIDAEKCDIIRYCEDNGLDFVTDSTNDDTAYSRNLIRHEVIPELRKVNRSAARNAGRLSSSARLADDFITEKTVEYMKICGNGANSVKNINALHPALKARVLEKMYEECPLNNGARLEEVHLDDLSSLIERGVGNSSLSLPGLIRAEIKKGRLYFVHDPRNDNKQD